VGVGSDEMIPIQKRGGGEESVRVLRSVRFKDFLKKNLFFLKPSAQGF
jgi:hypothetical protein